MAVRRSISRLHSLSRTWMPALLLALATLTGGARMASAQALDANLWITDGDVQTVVPWGKTLYIGGSFGYVGPNTGGWTELDAAGKAITRLPRVDGDVLVTESDGANGWWVGGSFTKVAGLARAGVAHVLADGSVATWTPTPAPTGLVTCIARQGTRVFVVTDQMQLRAYDATTGAQIGGWTPAVVGQVSSLAVDGTTLYAAGDITFTITTPSSAGNGIAAIDVNTGAIANWNPAPDGAVTKLYSEGRWLHVTGAFTQIGGQSHEGLARAMLATRAFDAVWAPSLDAPVVAFARVGSGLWISGGFFFVNGGFVDRITVVDTTTGATTGPVPSLGGTVEGQVTAMAIRAPHVYLGITPTFTFPRLQSARPLVARMIAATGQTDAAWLANGWSVPTSDVGSITNLQLTPSGGFVASGHFVSLGGRRQVAAAALDRTTGAPRDWDPNLSVDEAFPIYPSVATILPTNHAIYLGGYFARASGQVRKSLAAVDSLHGTLRPWKADLGPVVSLANGSASALALYQDKILVGGGFSSIAGAPRTNFALLDSVVGTPVPGWACDINDQVDCLLVQGGTVYIGGGFVNVGGQTRNKLAAVTVTTGAVTAWNPNVAGVQVWALATTNDTMYVAGDYSQVGTQTRVCLAAVSVSSGGLLGWAPQAFGPVISILIQGPNLLVGGEFGFLAGQPVQFLGALNRATGALATGTAVVDDRVLALASGGAGGGTYVAGSFGQFAGRPTAFLARTFGADAAGPGVVVVRANGGEYLAIGATYHFEYTASDPSGIASVDLEISRTGTGGPWTTLAAGMSNTGHFDWTVTGPAVAANAYLRVTARDFVGNLANDRSDAAFTIGAGFAGVEIAPHGGLTALSLGPNPARLETELRFTLHEPARVRFRMLDVQGRVVWAAPERSFDIGDHALPCALHGIAPGLYFMRAERGPETASARLIVVR